MFLLNDSSTFLWPFEWKYLYNLSPTTWLPVTFSCRSCLWSQQLPEYLSPWCLPRGAWEAHKTCFHKTVRVMSLSILTALWRRRSLKLSSPKARAKVGRWTGNQENALRVGMQWPQRRKCQLKIETRLAPLWEPERLPPEACGLVWTRVLCFMAVTWFICFHSRAGLGSYVEMTQFHIFVLMAKGQFFNRERQFRNNIFLGTMKYICGLSGKYPRLWGLSEKYLNIPW